MDEDETRAWIALALCAEGRPDQWLALARGCGGAVAAVRSSDADLAGHGALPGAIARLRAAWPDRAARVADRARRLGLGVSPFGGPGYPPRLTAIADPPLVLFWRGAEPSASSPAVAIVGARRATEYGERTARRLGAEVAAAGIVVSSGLARGIDAAAHRGALETGRTTAVLAGGLDRIYPREHGSLADRIVASGGSLLSEQPPGVPALPWLFPYRNRIITGLASATVVVEAAARSGSLASARHAIDQGREVFAVPGPVDSPQSAGTNGLLRQGAAIFLELCDLGVVDDIKAMIEKITLKNLEMQKIQEVEVSPEEALILAALDGSPGTADEISARTSLDGRRVLTFLTALELDGHVRREAHGTFRALARPRPAGASSSL